MSGMWVFYADNNNLAAELWLESLFKLRLSKLWEFDLK